MFAVKACARNAQVLAQQWVSIYGGQIESDTQTTTRGFATFMKKNQFIFFGHDDIQQQQFEQQTEQQKLLLH